MRYDDAHDEQRKQKIVIKHGARIQLGVIAVLLQIKQMDEAAAKKKYGKA